ncbi:hypothetical protein Bbelb_409200 [Branchiostoma belcheri]|nr:hypothetical protein Bbelb_409200 [Branchiostoma belcheri]
MASGLVPVIFGLVVMNGKIGGVLSEEFDILVIQPRQVSYAWSLDKITPAVAWAINTTGDTGLLGENHTFRIHTLDSECDNYKTKIKLLDMYYVNMTRPSAVIGPTCPFAVTETSRLAGQWSVPVLTAGASSATLRSGSNFDSEFKMLIRMGPTGGKMADAVMEFLSNKTFTRIAMVYHSEPGDVQQRPCHFCMTAIKQRLDNQPKNNASAITYVLYEQYTNRTSYDFSTTLDGIRGISRDFGKQDPAQGL